MCESISCRSVSPSMRSCLSPCLHLADIPQITIFQPWGYHQNAEISVPVSLGEGCSSQLALRVMTNSRGGAHPCHKAIIVQKHLCDVCQWQKSLCQWQRYMEHCCFPTEMVPTVLFGRQALVCSSTATWNNWNRKYWGFNLKQCVPSTFEIWSILELSMHRTAALIGWAHFGFLKSVMFWS